MRNLLRGTVCIFSILLCWLAVWGATAKEAGNSQFEGQAPLFVYDSSIDEDSGNVFITIENQSSQELTAWSISASVRFGDGEEEVTRITEDYIVCPGNAESLLGNDFHEMCNLLPEMKRRIEFATGRNQTFTGSSVDVKIEGTVAADHTTWGSDVAIRRILTRRAGAVAQREHDAAAVVSVLNEIQRGSDPNVAIIQFFSKESNLINHSSPDVKIGAARVHAAFLASIRGLADASDADIVAGLNMRCSQLVKSAIQGRMGTPQAVFRGILGEES